MRILFLIIITVFIFLLNLLIGSVDIPCNEVIKILLGQDVENESWVFIVIQSRLPQSITALFVGMALAGAGLILQTVFSNPLAGPSVLGIDAGASLGVAVVMLLLGGTITGISISGYLALMIASFIGAITVLIMLVFLASLVRNPIIILIIGIMMSFVTSSVISLLNFFSTPESVFSYTLWGMGDFSGVTLSRLPLFGGLILLGLVITFFLIKPMNALLLGEQYAENLGVSVRKVRILLLIITGILTAVTTAFCGPIAFVGLAVPHIARLYIGTVDNRKLLPVTILCGAIVTSLCNLCSGLPDNGVIPINILTPIFGAPIIIWVIIKGKEIYR